jgi:hypothetical protein
MSGQVIGIATIKINGKTQRTAPGASLDVGGVTRNPVNSGRANDFAFSETPAPSTLECEVFHDDAFNADDYRNAKDVTILFEADTGQTYIVKNATCIAPPVIKAGANVPLKFNGPPAVQA